MYCSALHPHLPCALGVSGSGISPTCAIARSVASVAGVQRRKSSSTPSTGAGAASQTTRSRVGTRRASVSSAGRSVSRCGSVLCDPVHASVNGASAAGSGMRVNRSTSMLVRTTATCALCRRANSARYALPTVTAEASRQISATFQGKRASVITP
jgi:hypothetical protein